MRGEERKPQLHADAGLIHIIISRSRHSIAHSGVDLFQDEVSCYVRQYVGVIAYFSPS